MAIEKNSFRVARFGPKHHSPNSKDTHMSSDNEELMWRNSVSVFESDCEDDDEYDDCDSGVGSDDFDLLELGETGEEFCQVGNQTCSIPFELYDLPGLKDILSMDVWNEVLTEEERFGLAKYLPDMDQENFVRTLKELFSGDNLHFGNHVAKLFDMLKGGLCEPRVALYRQGSNFFKLRKYYHHLQKHQNAMVNNVCQIRDTWLNCTGYSIEEKVQVLNIMKSQKNLMNEDMEEFKSYSSDREESGDGLWGKTSKNPKLGQKTGRHSGYNIGVMLDLSSRGRKTAMESAKYRKQNPRGTLKLAGPRTTSMKEVVDTFTSPNHGVEMKLGHYNGGLPPLQYNNPLIHDSSMAVRMKEHGKMIEDDDDEEETIEEVGVHRDQNYAGVGVIDKHGAFKHGKKHEGLRTEAHIDSIMGMPMSGRNDVHALGRNKTNNQSSDIKVLTAKPSHSRNIYDLQQFTPENFKLGKVQKMRLPSRGSEKELLGEGGSARLNKQLGGMLPADLSHKRSDSNAKTKKWKMGREAVDPNVNNKFLHVDRPKASKDKFQRNSLQNERREKLGNRGIRMFPSSDDTESDSSEQMDVDEDENRLMRSKWGYPGGVPDFRFGSDMKKTKVSKRDKKDSYVTFDGSGRSSQKMEDYGHNLEIMRAEQKGKMHDVGYLNIFPSKDLGEVAFPGAGNLIGNGSHQKFYQLGQNGHSEVYRGETFHLPSLKSSFTPERRLKGDINHGFGVPQPNNMHNSNFDESFWSQPLATNYGVPLKLGKKSQMVELPAGHYPEISDVPLFGCNTLPKKRKSKDDSAHMDNRDNNNYLHVDGQHLDGISPPRKRGKNKAEDAPNALGNGFSEPPIMEMETEDVEAEIKLQKKSFPLIMPTVHTSFSFSIIHLLSAVRVAMITLLPDDPLVAEKHNDESDSGEGVKEEQDKKHEDKPSMDVNSSMPPGQANVPSLTAVEIVNRVKSSPGDPCILETQEPLQDLVIGVLKIFSSRTAPLGAKGWKSLVVYARSTKSWSWVGPVSHNSSDSAVEEVTSPDAWGIPHKMLVKLVDCFANWLKNSQETLQQIGTLPAPPLELMQKNLDEKERFKDLRAQKSLSTICPSSDEVRAYFRKEEVLRYLIPDRAFSYTAIDGKKSIVAPLRRCGGKPTSKARDHFMLKRDRPPHVTILCLVRDAAARLPGSIGTRADVCTLIRDSQYIVEDVSDAQVNQVVSGALDRLHYERDPCVQFDGERKLWVYLHREREEEDFEDDGTSSTKKWRRQKKDTTEPSDQGDVIIAYPGPVGQSKSDLVSDLNVEASCAEDDKRSDHNSSDHVEKNAETSNGSDPGTDCGPTSVIWNGLGLNPAEHESLACQENSTHEDFDEDAFDGDPPP